MAMCQNLSSASPSASIEQHCWSYWRDAQQSIVHFFFLFVWHLRMHTMLSIIFRNQQWATYCILSWTANKWMYLLSDSLQCRQATWQHKTSCSIINWAPGIDTKSERVYPHRAQIMMLLKVERPFLRKENYRSNLLFWLPLEIFRFFFHFIFNFKVKSRLLYV